MTEQQSADVVARFVEEASRLAHEIAGAGRYPGFDWSMFRESIALDVDLAAITAAAKDVEPQQATRLVSLARAVLDLKDLVAEYDADKWDQFPPFPFPGLPVDGRAQTQNAKSDVVFASFRTAFSDVLHAKGAEV